MTNSKIKALVWSLLFRSNPSINIVQGIGKVQVLSFLVWYAGEAGVRQHEAGSEAAIPGVVRHEAERGAEHGTMPRERAGQGQKRMTGSWKGC